MHLRPDLTAALAAVVTLALSITVAAQQPARRPAPAAAPTPQAHTETTQEFNLRLQQMLDRLGDIHMDAYAVDYRIGPEDLLEISVLEAPEFSRTVRVSDDGEISLPLLGAIRVAGLTTRGLEAVLQNLLLHTYMKDPHVSVFVTEMRSHAVSVFGAVEKPGVYQIREAKTLIEVLSMAQGLADDAGDTVIVMRHEGDPADPGGPISLATASANAPEASTDPPAGSPPAKGPAAAEPARENASGSQSLEINLKNLLDATNPRDNALVYPGDIVKVNRAGIVYVVGEVRKPGGFLLKTNENISVLQALALAEGLTPDSADQHARIVTTNGPQGARREVVINLAKILRGRAPDLLLHSRDILFIPNSRRKAAIHAVYRSTEGIASAVSGAAVYRW